METSLNCLGVPRHRHAINKSLFKGQQQFISPESEQVHTLLNVITIKGVAVSEVDAVMSNM